MNDEIPQKTNDTTTAREPQSSPPPPLKPPSKIRTFFCWLEDHHSLSHWATAVFTLLLAGVAVGLVVFAKQTIETLERQIQETREAFRCHPCPDLMKTTSCNLALLMVEKLRPSK
jgi:hypothetical protein